MATKKDPQYLYSGYSWNTVQGRAEGSTAAAAAVTCSCLAMALCISRTPIRCPLLLRLRRRSCRAADAASARDDYDGPIGATSALADGLRGA